MVAGVHCPWWQCWGSPADGLPGDQACPSWWQWSAWAAPQRAGTESGPPPLRQSSTWPATENNQWKCQIKHSVLVQTCSCLLKWGFYTLIFFLSMTNNYELTCPRRFCPAHTDVWMIFRKSCPVLGLKMKMAPLIGLVVKLPSNVCKE